MTKREGTRVENKIHKNADTETLTPIITAIGLDLASGLSTPGKKNLVVEGISDYYYLQAMRHRLGITDDLRIIPCVGATKIPTMVSLLLGWGLDFVILVDNDNEGLAVAKQVKERFLLEESRVIHAGGASGAALEDLFEIADFNKLVFKDGEKRKDGLRNSAVVRRQDKPLLAKKFMSLVQESPEVQMSDRTKSSFASLFKAVGDAFTKPTTEAPAA